ncbi:2-keto-4-pentenoate hydratase [Acinetobacter nosocomialis]|uniref:2-keto-4-pentenoate hydratase n=1 Tax=Acinetobacter nosocomialis TaxID=106654 RepID=UPI0026F201CE|nr:fumarylacetoacetate hydrolase family protein [Acinetobacter nosocomialis]MDO7214394.1 fumarylacetoacetate hydrolase family protein [Acinetobacter nosocomialis]MDO7435508.1 fumarylacetoacetate hydrolase family protein [Acinetobacter nosocomialis]
MSINDQVRLETAAIALRNARHSRQTIEQISQSYKISGLDEAYAVAKINTDFKLSQGARIIGKKVGLTSKVVQKQLGVDQPDFGILFDDMEFLDGDEVPVSHLLQPKIEAEIAFIVGRDLKGPIPSWAEFLSTLDYALPALEIVDSAIHNWKITLEDTVADNASCGLFVLGNQPIEIGTSNLAEVKMELLHNNKIASEGSGVACLGHPLKAAWWLARTMCEKGIGLKAGEVILSGALGPMVNVQAGDNVTAYIDRLGSVSCTLI